MQSQPSKQSIGYNAQAGLRKSARPLPATTTSGGTVLSETFIEEFAAEWIAPVRRAVARGWSQLVSIVGRSRYPAETKSLGHVRP